MFTCSTQTGTTTICHCIGCRVRLLRRYDFANLDPILHYSGLFVSYKFSTKNLNLEISENSNCLTSFRTLSKTGCSKQITREKSFEIDEVTENRYPVDDFNARLAGDEDSGDKSRTFVFQDEGHTLGNALRCIISSYPDVQFCGYTVPHPAESKMHFRIQVRSGRAIDTLKQGLEDLVKMSDHTLELFEHEVNAFKTANHLNSTSI